MGATHRESATGLQGLRARWQGLTARWLERRAPAARNVTLGHRKLFILPSRAGLGFLLVILLLWLLGTNYENNLVFALAFLLVSLFAVLPVHTFANLSGLTIRLLAAPPAFAGDYARARIAVGRNEHRLREHIEIAWPPEEGAQLDLVDAESAEVEVSLPVNRRGKVRAPRLKVQSRFPLGLFRCWSHVDLDIDFLVYPAPKNLGPLPLGAAAGEGKSPERRRGGDDFAGLRPYQPGHSLRHVAWKQFAGGRDLHSKEYDSGADTRLWLDWDLLAGRDVETRLSGLCHWVLEAERAQIPYGLRLPGTTLAPSLGEPQRQRALAALAEFPLQGVE
ncbi:hypothetical protein AUP74_03229 [Microbulbifer aggregans]|uniref:Uncharacterized protein n=1 Tax=Microbulbifer aggregans TaxID=1769779 RepID=A0A1C9WBS3_9GAMM|nr:DUF58 domain-containing protein [Microbulbifer aggregans]AOS98595.1 hypothetical protein AUP74_03229 [Microbulbifer aggregans]